MTLDGMNEYLEKRGFTVERIYNPRNRSYVFEIEKDGLVTEDVFSWPVTSDWAARGSEQKQFLDSLIRKFDEGKEQLGEMWSTDSFESREEAGRALARARDILETCDRVTIEDFAHMCDRPRAHWMKYRGWYSLDDAYVARVQDGYTIMLPKPGDLPERKKNKEENKMNPFNPCYTLVDDTGKRIPVVIDTLTQTPGKTDTFTGHVVGFKYDLSFITARGNGKSQLQMEMYRHMLNSTSGVPRIQRVIHNDPATIVLWADGSKTVVKCQEGDIYDPEKGLAMAISKKALGNQGNYCNVFKKWLPEESPDKEVLGSRLEALLEAARNVAVAHALLNHSKRPDNDNPLDIEEAIKLSREGHKLWAQSRGAHLTNGNGWYYGIHNWAFDGYYETWVAYREKPAADA